MTELKTDLLASVETLLVWNFEPEYIFWRCMSSFLTTYEKYLNITQTF
jgi:hypothetical protein